MKPSQFDRVTKLFAGRRTPTVPMAAQEATPNPPGLGLKVPYLFLQSFEGGTITPKEGEHGTYTLTLEHGLGQTIYFGDRPSRDVGAVPTPRFLDGLGFDPTNPPNAAVVIDGGDGDTRIAVVELFNPVYDPVGPGVTYDVAVLEEWRDSIELGFSEVPADLSSISSPFGGAHLFIDDCAVGVVYCERCPEISSDCGTAYPFNGQFTNFCFYPPDGTCRPCVGIGSGGAAPEDETRRFWSDVCNRMIVPDWCNGACTVSWGPWKGPS